MGWREVLGGDQVGRGPAARRLGEYPGRDHEGLDHGSGCWGGEEEMTLRTTLETAPTELGDRM